MAYDINTFRSTTAMEMEFQKIETNRGNTGLLCQGHKFRLERKAKKYTSWQCTTKGCLARLKTDHEQENIVWSRLDHNHDPVSADSVTRQILRTECKRKAAENLTERPSKVIMKEIVSKPDTDLVPKDLIAIRQAMYRERRKKFPALPKTRQEVHEALQHYDITSNQGE